ncbi:MAG: type II secretion system F family protein [Planctomycetales bacterium]|nr:type II secretion system F family protein [Planctomycetales bacterium]
MATTELQAEILDGSILLDALKLRLAAQQATRRWQNPLASLASQLEQGIALETAISNLARAPQALRNVLDESLLAPDPTSLVLSAVRAQASNRQNRQALTRLVAYPSVLLGLSLAVGVAFSWLISHTLPIDVYREFELSGIEPLIGFIDDQYQAVLGMALGYLFVVLVSLTIFIAGPPWVWGAVVSGMVLIGRPLRWIALREILQTYHLFLSQGLPSVSAAEAVARIFRHSSQSIAATKLAQRMEAGIAPGQSLCLSLLSDGLTRPALRLLDLRGSHLPQALVETVELLGRLIEQRCRALSTVLPVFLLMIVGSVIWATMCTYLFGLLPLVAMISSLA